jgi:hypothetical protein
MAEYYAVLKKAISGLDGGSSDARRTVYDKARNALIGQLKAVDPPLTTAEISRQRLELEEAIRKVEREAAAAPSQPPRPAPARPAAQLRAAVAPAPAPVALPAEETGPSPQDVFRRAIQEAETRGSAAGASASTAIDRAAQQMRAEAQYPEPRSPRVERVVPPREPPPDEPHEDFDARDREYAGEPRLAPEYGQEWEQERGSDRGNGNGRGNGRAAAQPEPMVDRRDRPAQPKGRRRGYLEQPEDDREALTRVPRRSRLPGLLLFILILAVIGGVGAFGWSQREKVMGLIASFDGPSAPKSAPAAPAVADDTPASTKDSDRLPGVGDQASSDGGQAVRSVDPRPVDSGDAAPMAAAPTPGATGDGAPAGDTASAEEPASGDALVAQKAVLYEEPLDAANAASGVTAINAAVTWRYAESGPNGPEIQADLQVPERGMRIKFTIHKNSDTTLPASHLIEVVVDTPPDFPGKGIKSVPRIVMKPTEEARGQPLVGAPAKVTDGFFWVALSAADADISANLALLRERNWIDLPFVYNTGQRAILTFEKGTPGDRVFEKAITAWTSQG